MDSCDIERRIERIKEVPGKNDKIALLEEHLEEPRFREAIFMMLDPRLRFGVAKKTLDKVEAEPSGTRTWFVGDSCNIRNTLYAMAEGRITGARTIEALTHIRKALEPESWSLLRRILLKKPDAGFTASSVKKARPNTVWTFDCMLAHPFEAKRVKSWPVVVEPKIDGVRCLIMVRTLPVTKMIDIAFFSRTGKEFTAFGEIERGLRDIIAETRVDMEFGPGLIIDAEIDSGDFLATVSQARRKDEQALDAVARCFDVLGLDEWEKGVSTRPFYKRRAFLEKMLGSDIPRNPRLQVLPQWHCHSEEEIMQHNARVRGDGGEGVIVKPVDHPYERKRSHNWLKIKGFETHDLVIKDVFEGEGKYVGKLGGVICDYDGVDVSIGGGWSDEDRAVVWANPGTFIGRMIEVGAHETTPDGSLRHPRFLRFRWDKGGRQDDLPEEVA